MNKQQPGDGGFTNPTMHNSLEDAVASVPPPGLTDEELELWLENAEDERLFGEGK